MNERTKAFMLLCVNSIEKGSGMKTAGLQIPEKDHIYVKVGFPCYYRAKIIVRVLVFSV